MSYGRFESTNKELGAHRCNRGKSLTSCALCRASYCEIYNEALYDLLKFTKQQLQVRWDSGKGFYVPELAVKECTCVEDMLQVMSNNIHTLLLCF